MYRNPLFWAAMLVLLSIASFFGVGAFEEAHTSFALRHDVDTITVHAVQQLDAVNAKKLSQDLGKTIMKANDTITDIQITAKKESKYLDTWSVALTQTLDGINKLVGHVDETQKEIGTATVGTLSATTAIEQSVQPILANAATTLTTSNTAISDLDKFIKSPDVATMMSNGVKITTSAATITDTAEKVTTKATKPYLHPIPQTFKQKLVSGIKTWAEIIAKVAVTVY